MHRGEPWQTIQSFISIVLLLVLLNRNCANIEKVYEVNVPCCLYTNLIVSDPQNLRAVIRHSPVPPATHVCSSHLPSCRYHPSPIHRVMSCSSSLIHSHWSSQDLTHQIVERSSAVADFCQSAKMTIFAFQVINRWILVGKKHVWNTLTNFKIAYFIDFNNEV